MPWLRKLREWSLEERKQYLQHHGIVTAQQEAVRRMLLDLLRESALPEPWSVCRDEEKMLDLRYFQGRQRPLELRNVFFWNSNNNETSWVPCRTVVVCCQCHK